jgi:acyl-CoA synthetase (AMP-forming)/AMP-acid ligase II
VSAVGVAFVAERTRDAAAVRRYARERLAGFKVPAFWYSAGSLPHSAAGKLLRSQLAAWHDDPGTAAEPMAEEAADPQG